MWMRRRARAGKDSTENRTIYRNRSYIRKAKEVAKSVEEVH
jgi:hypothetical protein